MGNESVREYAHPRRDGLLPSFRSCFDTIHCIAEQHLRELQLAVARAHGWSGISVPISNGEIPSSPLRLPEKF
jgi:hypothetical protein